MTFLASIIATLQAAGDTVVLREMRGGEIRPVTAREFLGMVGQARAALAARGLSKGDRCALLAHNSIEWAALDLAIMAEGLIVVPLYARQAPAELVAMMRDCTPSLLCCGDALLLTQISQVWPEGPPSLLFEQVFAAPAGVESSEAPLQIQLADLATIIYTSGTSGEAKGVALSHGNVTHMLSCTSGRLDDLMSRRESQDSVFHYLPFCFAGSWILLLTCLRRGSLLSLNTDIGSMSNDMRQASPHYFLNVPALLERVRRAVDEQLWKTGGFPRVLYSRAKGAWVRQHEGRSQSLDSMWLRLANTLIFPAIRKKMIGANLRALICGSAPLNLDTQLWFHMLGIPVLQVYGLTETTAICTMDDPHRVAPGRVGPAIAGVEMKLGENDEIMVRGPNIFPGYWNRPQETARVLQDGWFRTGDQGEVDAAGNWRIIGRIKNLIILGSGHNVAPEPIEEKILEKLPAAQQVVLTGNGRGFLAAVVTGESSLERVQAALDAVNQGLPHYKQVRAVHLHPEPFSIENGLLTANGKLKRDAIAARLAREIDRMYAVRQAV